MTPQVKHVRSAEVAWEPLGTHGLRRKVLGFDPRDQHVTALVDIPVGWRGGGIAHYHHAFEEVFMLSGSVTVGGTHYWHAGDYFYRPADIVHGHDERSEEGTLAVIRSDGPLELLLIHDPDEPDEYPRSGPISDPRGHILQIPTGARPWIDSPDLPEGWRVKPLSADAESGARTMMIRIPQGWSGDTGAGRDTAWEALILNGSLRNETRQFDEGDYCSGPAGVEVFDIRSTDAGCELLVWQFARDRIIA